MKLKILLITLVLGWLGFTTFKTIQSLFSVADRVTQTFNPVQPDTVYVTADSVRSVIEEANNPKLPTILQRITEVEVAPEKIYISRADTVYLPGELPAYGMQKVEKDDKQLRVTSLARDGSESQLAIYSIPDASTDYVLTSGTSAATLRVSRTWDLVSLEAEVIGVVGAGGVKAVVTGPVSINATPNLQVSPALLYEGGDGLSVGVAAKLTF